MSRYIPKGFENLRVDTGDRETIKRDLLIEVAKYKKSESSSDNIMDLLESYNAKPLLDFENHMKSLISVGLNKSNTEWITFTALYQMPKHLNVLLYLGFSRQPNVIFDLVDGNAVQSVSVLLDFIGDEYVSSIRNSAGQNITDIVKKTSLEMIGLFKTRGWTVETNTDTHYAALAAYKALKKDENSSSAVSVKGCVSTEASTFDPSSAAGAMASSTEGPCAPDREPIPSRYALGNQRVVDGEFFESLLPLLGQPQEAFKHGSESDF